MRIFTLLLIVYSVNTVSAMDMQLSVVQQLSETINTNYPDSTNNTLLIVDVARQELIVWRDGHINRVYSVSTARRGTGSVLGSYRTPLGTHTIRKKIGEDAPIGTIFAARENTHKIASIEDKAVVTGKDLVTSRILWLSGMEKGLNQGGDVDSFRRYIYIHGTNEEGLIGEPASKGCIRMFNADIIELYASIPVRTIVYISENLAQEPSE